MNNAVHHGSGESLNRLAFSATLHCLTGCSIGEILGMIVGSALGWGNFGTIALAVVLAFFFGYMLTMFPLLRSGMEFRNALRLALTADTITITVMEIVDNAIILTIPGAMDAAITEFCSGAVWHSRFSLPVLRHFPLCVGLFREDVAMRSSISITPTKIVTTQHTIDLTEKFGRRQALARFVVVRGDITSAPGR